MQLFFPPNILQADPSFTSKDSVLAVSGTNILTSEDDAQLTESMEVIISMEKETPDDKPDSGKESDGVTLKDSFEDLKDPFAEETPEYPPIEDPFEAYNRFMYEVNDTFFIYLLQPISMGYRAVIPEGVRLSVKNLFENIRSPINLVGSLLQGDMEKTGRVLGRLIINSTIGIGGLFDVAKSHFDIQPVNEDFDQVLGFHGVSTGPYIVLPLLGPSSGRNVIGSTVDTLLNPITLFSPTVGVGTGINFANITNQASFNLDAYDDLKDSAVDPYVSLRDFNHQYREGLIEK